MKKFIVAAILAGCAALYFLVDPATSHLIPKCPVHTLTGLDCPGCGSQRAFHALLHGEWGAAWHYNAFLLIMAPLILLYLFASMKRLTRPWLYAALNSPAAIIIISSAIVVWTILRNTIRL